MKASKGIVGTLDLLQKCFLQELGKGKRLKGKGTIQNLYPFPLALFPTYARSLLFNIIGIGSLVVLSACAQPVAETPTATVLPVTPTPTATIATQNLAELAKSAANQGQFKTLIQVVQVAGLTEQLAKPGPFTVFAPTDAAFSALPKATLDQLLQPANKQRLVKLLSYHVIPGGITSQQLTSGEVKTIEGSPIKITVDRASNSITVNNAKVTQPDIPASNGIVHVVDQVLLPPNFPASLNTTPTPR